MTISSMLESKEVVAAVRNALKAGVDAQAMAALQHLVKPDAPFVVQARSSKLFFSTPKTIANLRPVKVAVLSSSTVDHLVDVLRYWLAMSGLEAEIYIAPFDTIVQTIFDRDSELYAFKPDIVWLFTTFRDVRADIEPGADVTVVRDKVGQAVNQTSAMWDPLLTHLQCIVLQNNVDIPATDRFGNGAGGYAWGNESAMRLYNFELAAAAPPGVTIYDLDHVSAIFGKSRWIDARYWFHSKHAFNLDATGLVAHAAAQIIAALNGLSKKCLVLDLDNTLWGGVIGDDGLEGIKLGVKADGEAFTAFQAYVKSLQERGIILAVCSKNEEAAAREPFEKHPDMRLRLDDISVFRANWDNKVDNIRAISDALNIGLDSLVFVDDNPAEREIVRQFLPMVAVPDMPDDPSNYIEAIAAGRYFESTSFSSEDKDRARYYRENSQRTQLQMSFSDIAGYLANLEMEGEIGSFDAFHQSRMAQLINKSNQFHLTGSRYSQSDLAALSQTPGVTIRYFKLRDHFGDNGLISVVVLKQVEDILHIDTWVMSCRVLGRTMEEFILGEILTVARKSGCLAVEGRYIPSTKNMLVADLYGRLGFLRTADQGGTTSWRRDLNDDAPTTQIKRSAAGF